MLINRPPAPVETYNDLDAEVVNFFACLRDGGEELVRLISLTPFSRAELVNALAPRPDLPPMERARRFFAAGAPDPDRAGANQFRRALGALCPDLARGYGRRGLTMAG